MTNMMETLKNDKSNVITVAGIRGSGKTYLASRWFTDVDKQEKVIYIDVVGALRDYLPSIDPNIQVLEIDRIVSHSDMDEVFNKIFKEGKIKKILFDISNLKRREAIYSVDLLFSYLLKNHYEYAVLIDEIGELIPQSHVYYSEETERLIRIGRNKGLKKVVLTTQRLQQTDKTAIAQSNYYIFFRMIHNLDLKAIREILGVGNDEFHETMLKMKNLDIGEFIVTDGLKNEGIFKYDSRTGKVRKITEFEKVNVLKQGNDPEFEPETLKRRRKNSKEDKLRAVKEYHRGATLIKLSEKYGVSQTSVHKWIKKESGIKRKTKKR